MSAPVLQRRRQRLAIDMLGFEPPRDVDSGWPVRAWLGSSLRLDLAFFYRAALASVAQLAAITIEFKAQSGDESAPAPAADDAPLLSVEIDSFDNTVDAATWAAGTKQHATVEFTAAQMTFTQPAKGRGWIVISGTFTDDSETTILAAGPCEMLAHGMSESS